MAFARKHAAPVFQGERGGEQAGRVRVAPARVGVQDGGYRPLRRGGQVGPAQQGRQAHKLELDGTGLGQESEAGRVGVGVRSGAAA